MSVYIIPGFFRRASFYQPLLDRLQQAGLPAEIIDLGINVRNLEHATRVVLGYLKRTEEKDDIIAHSFGGLVLKRILFADPKITAQIRSLSFAAVPHQGSWAALLVPIWPAALNMLPFTKELKKTATAVLPANTMNFLPETEFKVWPKRSSRLNDFVDAVIPRSDHDSIIASKDFAGRVIEFIKTCK